MLREKIKNIEEGIEKRRRDLQDDPEGLPGSCPGDKAKPMFTLTGVV
jgi:hypothetical protein